MSAWPESMQVGPIREWPGELTAERRMAPFSATLSNTLGILSREVYNLADTQGQQDSAEVLLAIPAGAFRLDGRPYANAKADHPGVIFSMQSRHGQLSYPCDTFTTWQDNLRAIALALEALRKVDRYGVTRHGEQYRGFLALEATVAPMFVSTDAAAEHLLRVIGGDMTDLRDKAGLAGVVRRAKFRTHPDHGGTAEEFQRVLAAEEYLRANGGLS